MKFNNLMIIIPLYILLMLSAILAFLGEDVFYIVIFVVIIAVCIDFSSRSKDKVKKKEREYIPLR